MRKPSPSHEFLSKSFYSLSEMFDRGGWIKMENAIEVVGLTKYYGSFLAVDGVSFSVKTNEIFGFLGPNGGAGKTTTIRMLTGGF